MDKPPKNKGETSLLAGRGMIAGLLVIIVILAAAAIFFATTSTGSITAVPAQTCAQDVVSYLNANFVQAGTSAALGTVSEKNGIYLINVQYQGRIIPLYATRDCTLLFPNMIDLTANVSAATPTQPAAAMAKTASPEADLYVMSFCPYGTQAETAMQPVVNLLGAKANITVRYIASVQGTTASSVSSLHGPGEAMEDLRQLCINQLYPQQLWPYLAAFDANCYPNVQNATLLDACRVSTMQALGIDPQAIETCATSPATLELLSADETLTNTNGVQASPTLIINGQVYNGARTPEAYKEAICSAFTTPPAECSVNLSATGTAVTGGCG